MIELINIFGQLIYSSQKTTIVGAIEEAVKKGISLRYIDLAGVNLGFVNFRYLDMSYSNLSGVIIAQHSDFSCSNLSHSNLTNADISYCNLWSVNLSYSNLTNADLSYSNLTNADISHSNLTDTLITCTEKNNINFWNTNTWCAKPIS